MSGFVCFYAWFSIAPLLASLKKSHCANLQVLATLLLLWLLLFTSTATTRSTRPFAYITKGSNPRLDETLTQHHSCSPTSPHLQLDCYMHLGPCEWGTRSLAMGLQESKSPLPHQQNKTFHSNPKHLCYSPSILLVYRSTTIA